MTVEEIELHPGHWKNPSSGANGILNEVTEARRVTKRVHEILKEAKVPCTYFEDNTSTNQKQNLNTLVKHHNADRNGLIVSIHLNAGGDSSKGIGTEVLYKTQKNLAANVSKAISDASGLKNRGAKYRDNLAILTQTYEPAILIEVCFVNSVVDAELYRKNFERICQAIARELAAYLGKSINNKQQSTNTSNKKPERKLSGMKPNWKDWQWEEAAEIYKKARVKGILSSDEWEKKAAEKNLTFDEIEYLNLVLNGRLL
ncbi:N-acetylmuramoyl-L-alanine amidase [Robertmurraya siralis]|uniref:N-acetylmuramoyl-L-alanine amidase n=1 Tax=Robertmurraya siralis TaxID=77777 RepID=UPI0010FA42FE|nr:N-acetylmuramoyl-L-alanine amidase [Robertmurraya siralis]